MKTIIVITIILLLAFWLIPNALRVRKILFIQKCMEKDHIVCSTIMRECEFSEVPTKVMKIKGCAELVYILDGYLHHTYLVNHSPLSYDMALSLLYMRLQNNSKFNNKRHD